MNSLVLILGTVAAAMSGIAILALHRARLASSHCLDLELLIIDAEQRFDDIEIQILHLMKGSKKTADQIDRLAVDQSRRASIESGTGFREAIALIQHGATAGQLISKFGISSAEAHLIETLYGKDKSSALPESPHKFSSPNECILIDAHLDTGQSRPEIQ